MVQAQTVAQAQTALRAQAQAALDKSDVVLLRAQEDGITFPQIWKDLRTALRVVVKAGGALPTVPATFPDGTAVPAGW